MPVSARGERPRASWDEVRRATNAELRSAKPDSPSAFARRLGVDPSHLRNTFPEAAKNLSALYRATKASERATARAELVVVIREHLETRSRAGRRVSLRAAFASLNVNRHNEDVRAASARCRSKNWPGRLRRCRHVRLARRDSQGIPYSCGSGHQLAIWLRIGLCRAWKKAKPGRGKRSSFDRIGQSLGQVTTAVASQVGPKLVRPAGIEPAPKPSEGPMISTSPRSPRRAF